MNTDWRALWTKYGMAILVLIGTLLWSLPSILNNFPLMYSDSIYYIDWLLRPNQPSSIVLRPRTYSYLILWPSLRNFGFLTPIFLQNLASLTLLAAAIPIFINKHHKKAFITFILLAPLTPLVYTANFLTPDIFSGFTLLAFTAMVLADSKLQRGMFLLALCLFSLMHFANLVVSLLLAVLFLARRSQRHRWLFAPVVVIFLFGVRLCLFQPSFDYEKTAHLFLNSKLRAQGPAIDWLVANCPHIQNFFCEEENHNFEIWKDLNSSSVKKTRWLSRFNT